MACTAWALRLLTSPAVGAYLREHPELRVSSVFSHLAAADEPDKRDFTERQAKTFIAATEALTAALGYQPKRHLLNTAGIERFPEYALDMARSASASMG